MESISNALIKILSPCDQTFYSNQLFRVFSPYLDNQRTFILKVWEYCQILIVTSDQMNGGLHSPRSDTSSIREDVIALVDEKGKH